jgi:hypothetical protein
MTTKMKSKSTIKRSEPVRAKEFAAKTGSKPGVAAKAQKVDNKQDKALAKKFGVKWVK